MNKCFSIVLLTLVLASCHNSGDRKATTTAPTTPITFTAPLVLDTNKSAKTTSTPAATTPSSNGTTTATLNPAHGAPGHRCEIPVGAPLNTPAPAATTISTPTVMPTAPQPVNNNNARINPAHGAPGHDCSIPVGQPLKS